VGGRGCGDSGAQKVSSQPYTKKKGTFRRRKVGQKVGKITWGTRRKKKVPDHGRRWERSKVVAGQGWEGNQFRRDVAGKEKNRDTDRPERKKKRRKVLRNLEGEIGGGELKHERKLLYKRKESCWCRAKKRGKISSGPSRQGAEKKFGEK